MKPNSKKRSANKSGSVLVTAVSVLIIMSVLMTATVGYVSVNRKKTNTNYCHKQAYLTASTTLKSIVNQIELDTARPGVGTSADAVEQAARIAAIEALADAPGGDGTTVDVTYNGNSGNEYKVGTTKVKISREESGDGLVATAYTTYGGVTEKVACHFFVEAKKKPVEFTNTIETIGGDSMDPWDNISVIGDTAVLNTEGNKVYVLRNDTNPQGSFYMYGHLVPGSAQMKFTLSSSQTDPKRGTHVQISGGYFGEIKAESSMARGDGFNYIYIGGKANFTRNSYVGRNATNAIDIITHSLTIDRMSDSDFNKYLQPLINAGAISSWGVNGCKEEAGSYEQYGNIYVYKNGGDLELNGNAVFNVNGSGAVIHGDLNVEGDLYCNKKVTVDGTVNVGGTIHNSANLSCSNVNTGVTIDKTGRGAVPKMECESNDYKNMPEDLVKNSDPKIGTLRTQFNALHKKSGGVYTAKKFSDMSFRKDTEVDDGQGGKAKFRFYVNQDCIWDNVNSNSEFMNGNGNVLVHVTNKDIVIMLDKSLQSLSDQQFQIVVKNDSPIEDHDGGPCHRYNCYFVSDMDQNGALKFTGRNAAGISQHEGSTPLNIEMRSLRVYDFDTYVHMFPSSYYNNYKLNNIIGQKPKSDFIFNSSSNDKLPGVFTTKAASIYFFFGEGCKITFSNNTLIQAIIYAPQAEFLMKTQGIGGFTCCDSAGYTGSSKDIGVMGIGVFIARRFQSENAGYYVYTRPAATSALNNAKPNKDNYMNGFKIDRFDHY